MIEANVQDIKGNLPEVAGSVTGAAVFVHEKISKVAARQPYTIAISAGAEVLTYLELETLSNRLANHLVKEGIKPETKVGICMEPGLSLAVVIVAILKSGGAYIHLSPLLPPSRIETILKDADAPLLITSPALAVHVAATDIGILNYNINQWMTKQGDEYCPEVELKPEHAAYVLYTSGSTGKPKGVVIEHRNLNYYLDWTTGAFAAEIGARIPLTSSMSFAAGVTQFYSALLKGYTLHILPPDMVRQPMELLQWYANHPGYALYCVPTLWNEILNWKEQNGEASLPGPDCIILSGEAVSDKLVVRTYELFPGIKAWNLYGPTEAVANLSGGRLLPGEKITIGKPLPDTKLFVINENGEGALPGETGELFATGPGIARGYLGREDLTAKTFINYQSHAYGEVRVYRTGDLVKLQDDGAILYVGRNDQQVKIRGFRIELMEVELVVKQLDNVKHAVVKACETTAGEKILVAYIVPVNGSGVSVTSLRKELAGSLPDYMLPERWVLMDAFPTLANGKIDRGQLPLPGNPRPALGYATADAVTDVERKMVYIFEKVLGFSGIGMDDNFFDLGGTSLKINTIIYEVKQAFGAAITYRSIFNHPTPKGLLGSLDHTLSAAPAIPAQQEKINNHNGQISLAPNQAGLWFLHQVNKNSAAYNIPYCISIKGGVNVHHLKSALQALIDRHIPLRSSAAMLNGMPMLHVNKHVTASVELVDLGFMARGESLKNAQDAIELSATIPFDLLVAPLFRVQLFKLDKEEYLLGLVVHHMIFDGWSMNVFHRELLDHYSLFIQGGAVPPPALKASYADYALGYDNYAANSEFHKARDFWKQQLNHTTNQFIFPHDFTPLTNKSEQGGRVEYRLNAELKQQLKSTSKQYGATLYTSLMSAFMVLVHGYNKQDDILIATAVANRRMPDLYPLIGFFTNTLLIRADMNAGRTFADFLKHVTNSCIGSFEYEYMPYAEQIRLLHEQGCVVHPSGVEIMFAYHEMFESVQNKDLDTSVKELFNRSAKFPIFLECQDEHDGIRISLTYDKNLYHDQSMIRLMDQYTSLLNCIAADPSAEMEHYSIGSNFEGNQGLQRSNLKKYSDTMVLHRLFEQAADKYEEQTAIRHNGKAYTYRQIDEWANMLAWHLMDMGIKANEPVGIFMEHSAEMVASMLAVLKIGAHYVPLDPDYPAKRNIYVTEHARLNVIITDSRHTDTTPCKVGVIIAADDFLNGNTSKKENRPVCQVAPGELAYIMYTSGSTGNPKGVMVPHKGVCNYVLWMKEQFSVDVNDRVLAKSSISFDVSVWELFLPLISGGRLILNDRLLMKAPDQVANVIKEEEVNIIQFVPSGLKAFADADVLRGCKTLEKIFCGGEKLPVQLQEEVFKQFNGELHNIYGPTEASIFCCHFQCGRTDRYRSVPVGKPIPNTGVSILDEQLRPIPAGCIGDIYICGDILATGYLNDERQTTAAFISHDGEIIYKTGDRGRYLYNGNIEFHGRKDHQVKVRGYRIELGEIEQVALQYPGIQQAVVIRKEWNEADVRLIIYVAVTPGEQVDEQDLRQFMRQHLPEYMLPSGYNFVAEIPVLPNGKTDFRSLETTAIVNKQEKITEEHFRGDIEKILAEIWTDVLGRDNFKLTDNFMDAGGHSILLAKVVTQLNERLKQNYSLIDLFQYPSIESFAKFYREKYAKNSSNTITMVQDRIAKRKQKLNENKKRTS